jgi:hypothetical protein
MPEVPRLNPIVCTIFFGRFHVAHGGGRGTGLADAASAPRGDLAGLKNSTK